MLPQQFRWSDELPDSLRRLKKIKGKYIKMKRIPEAQI